MPGRPSRTPNPDLAARAWTLRIEQGLTGPVIGARLGVSANRVYELLAAERVRRGLPPAGERRRGGGQAGQVPA